MSDDAIVRVDQQKVRDLFLGEGEITIGELTRVSCAFGDQRGSVAAPPIALPAKLALQEALSLLGQAFGTIQRVMLDHREKVERAMDTYASVTAEGTSTMDGISARIGAPSGTDPHSYLTDRQNQVDERLAEIGVWRNFDPAMVRPRPGDMLTVAGRLLVVGPDGRLYENGAAVAAPVGQEVRMYRRMGGETA